MIQEMSARMGAVTGKGLSDLIREEFGFRVTFFLMLALVVTNFGNIVAEFAGVASALELFKVSKYIVVPLAALFVWALVVHGTYNSVEKIFLSASLFYVAYVVSGVLAKPDWRAAALSTVTRPDSVGFRNYGYLSLVIGLVGTTIAPWMQFYLQASIVEKGVDRAVPGVARRCDRRLPVRGNRRMVHCRRLRGDAARSASSTSKPAPMRQWRCGRSPATTPSCCSRRPVQRIAVCGVDSADLDGLCSLRRVGPGIGADKRFDNADSLVICRFDRARRRCLAAAAVPFVPRDGASQVVNGILLPFVLVFMLLLMNDRELMGEHVNSRWYNVVSWFTVVAMAALSIALLIAQARG
jgi:Mn2+/Fe2+ NRAMP family transporter